MWRSVLRLSRFCTRTPICSHLRLPLLSPPTIHQPSGHSSGIRGYSNHKSSSKRVIVVGVPNPVIWFRTKIYFFLIRAYYDRDFSVEEFTEGAKQAFSFVSRKLSQCKFDELENLVASEILNDLKDKCSVLSDEYRKGLEAKLDQIMYTFPGDVAIYYDDDGRKFVSILMRFCYLTYANVPEEKLEGVKSLKVVIGNQDIKDTKHIVTANYEFRREFTKGVKPDWIISRIEYLELLK